MILRRNMPPVPVDQPQRHVIAEYKHRAQTVTCECGWFGSHRDHPRRTVAVAVARGGQPARPTLTPASTDAWSSSGPSVRRCGRRVAVAHRLEVDGSRVARAA